MFSKLTIVCVGFAAAQMCVGQVLADPQLYKYEDPSTYRVTYGFMIEPTGSESINYVTCAQTKLTIDPKDAKAVPGSCKVDGGPFVYAPQVKWISGFGQDDGVGAEVVFDVATHDQMIRYSFVRDGSPEPFPVQAWTPQEGQTLIIDGPATMSELSADEIASLFATQFDLVAESGWTGTVEWAQLDEKLGPNWQDNVEVLAVMPQGALPDGN